ncbi:MAG: hypothetical protein AB1791_17985 [Chloroflexota bacterium]
MILGEDGYHQVKDPPDANIGDIVVYRAGDGDASHVGIIIHIEPVIGRTPGDVYVLSKWGQEGEYIHLLDEVPSLLGKPAEFWSDRKVYL